jgi:hypothetical protein
MHDPRLPLPVPVLLSLWRGFAVLYVLMALASTVWLIGFMPSEADILARQDAFAVYVREWASAWGFESMQSFLFRIGWVVPALFLFMAWFMEVLRRYFLRMLAQR